MLKGGWFDPGDFHFQLQSFSVSHHRLPWAFITVSVTVIYKVGLANHELYVYSYDLQNLTSKNTHPVGQ